MLEKKVKSKWEQLDLIIPYEYKGKVYYAYYYKTVSPNFEDLILYKTHEDRLLSRKTIEKRYKRYTFN